MAGASEEADSSSQTAACKHHIKADLCDMWILCGCYIISSRCEHSRGDVRKSAVEEGESVLAPIQMSCSEVQAVVYDLSCSK